MRTDDHHRELSPVRRVLREEGRNLILLAVFLTIAILLK
jgi:hypothetical protein